MKRSSISKKLKKTGYELHSDFCYLIIEIKNFRACKIDYRDIVCSIPTQYLGRLHVFSCGDNQIIILKYKKENCELAKLALMELLLPPEATTYFFDIPS